MSNGALVNKTKWSELAGSAFDMMATRKGKRGLFNISSDQCQRGCKNKASHCIALLFVVILLGQHRCSGLSNSNFMTKVAPANLPTDLPKIQSCRITAFVDQKKLTNEKEPKLRRSQLSFINADAAVKGDSICVVAQERFPPFSILGTADVSSKPKLDGTYLIQNVFVLPEARGRGLAKRLVEGVEQLVLQKARSGDEPVIISLNVETSNTPAVSLYQKCDYEATGVDSAVLGVGRTTGFPLLVSMVKELS